MAVPAHKTEYFIIENSNLQKKANTAPVGIAILYVVLNCMHEQFITSVFNDIAIFD